MKELSEGWSYTMKAVPHYFTEAGALCSRWVERDDAADLTDSPRDVDAPWVCKTCRARAAERKRKEGR